MAKKRKYIKQAFESTGANSDTSANIYVSMLLSTAWQDLSASAQCLYVVCKAQYYAEKSKPNDDPLCFTMSQAKWSGLYKLYKKSNAKGFYRDMAALIEHGFISCVESGACTRTKSIYRFSAKWRDYGTPAFTISPAEMNTPMRKMYLKNGEKKPPA